MGEIRVEHEGQDLVRLEIEGVLDADTVEAGLDAFLAAVEPLERFNLIYFVRDVGMPTLGAMRVEMRYFGRFWRLLPRIGRAALVADQTWIRAAARAEGAVIPGLEIETFTADEEDRARAWLAG